jgi:hypothetical protein
VPSLSVAPECHVHAWSALVVKSHQPSSKLQAHCVGMGVGSGDGSGVMMVGATVGCGLGTGVGTLVDGSRVGKRSQRACTS